MSIIEILDITAAVLLVPFVVWGAWWRSPYRPFSWAMYTESSKVFLWTVSDRIPRVPSHRELRLAPRNHTLTLDTLRCLFSEAPPAMPLEGLIIGSGGGYRVRYDCYHRHLTVTPLSPGTELAVLQADLRQLMTAADATGATAGRMKLPRPFRR